MKYILANKFKILLASLIIAVFYVFYAIKMQALTEPVDGYFTLADICKTGMDTEFSGFVITPLLLYLLHSIFRYDFLAHFILRRKSKVEIFLVQVQRVFIISGFLAVVMAAASCLTGMSLNIPMINWGSKNSMFYLATGKIAENLTFLEVLTVFILVNFVRNIIICIVSLLLYWLTETELLDYILFLGVTAVEVCFPDIHILYSVLDISYRKWAEPFGYVIIFVYCSVFMVCFTGIIYFVMKRKEFRN